jgi:protein-S-isoprenylcysteine O-methyltransferase Ste14
MSIRDKHTSIREKHTFIGIIPRILWTLQIISLVAAEHYLGKGFTLNSDAVTVIPSLCFIVTGVASLIWSAVRQFMALSSKGFIKEGPYRFVRHPVHVSAYLIFIGIALIVSSYIWIIILSLFVPVWYKVCRMEERWMLELHGVEYLGYLYRTGMFFPK